MCFLKAENKNRISNIEVRISNIKGVSTRNQEPETRDPNHMPDKNIQNDPQYYIRGVLERNRRILAKTITLIESSHPFHQDLARSILDGLIANTGKAVRLGVTGVPGVGKSTFVRASG